MIGIRAEDKNEWERRAPLTPQHVSLLADRHGVGAIVEPSIRRVFADADYRLAGATISEDLTLCRIVLGVKEIPIEKLAEKKVYLFFSHVIKGQAYNMPMLRRLMELGCTLIDYERVVDEKGNRLIFFGFHAGYAGMIDTLWALGERLADEGVDSPLSEIHLAHQYGSLEEAKAHITDVGERIARDGIHGVRPPVFAFTGSGNVASGAHEIFELLPFDDVDIDDVASLDSERGTHHRFLRCAIPRERRFRRRDGEPFDANDFAASPERYESTIDEILPHITVFVNGVYWDPRHPRLIAREDLDRLWKSEEQPKLRVVGDITCDIGGSIEATVKATSPGDPVFVYDPATGEDTPGVSGRGVVVMAVDNLPCELPAEASEFFGDALVKFVPALEACDWDASFENLALPPEIEPAVIVHRGELTPRYAYLREFVGMS